MIIEKKIYINLFEAMYNRNLEHLNQILKENIIYGKNHHINSMLYKAHEFAIQKINLYFYPETFLHLNVFLVLSFSQNVILGVYIRALARFLKRATIPNSTQVRVLLLKWHSFDLKF